MAQAKKGLSTRDLVLIGILLAAGTVLKAIFPKLPVTPNFIIAMYSLAILLIRPTILETLGIGVVAAILSQITTAAPVPFMNFISEPVASMVCFALCLIPFSKGFGGNVVRPASITFVTTVVSGTIFVSLISIALLARGSGAKWALIYIVVLPTAAANMVITTLCYSPLRRVLKIKDEE